MRAKLKFTAKGSLNNIKVCHIIITLSIIGGAQRMLIRLLSANPESMEQNMVVVLCRAGAWGEQLQSAGVTVHELGMDSIMDLPRVFYQLIKLISSFKPDIVQTWMYHADLVGGLAAWISGYNNIIWGIRHTAALSNKPRTVLVMKICAFLSHWIPKKIVCVAEASREEHIKCGYDAGRMDVIHNGFDFSDFTVSQEQRDLLRKECHVSEEDILVGCVGRFHSDKGQENFVKGAKIVSLTHLKVKFLLVGTDCDANNATLMRWLNDNGVQDRFVLLGERNDVSACLAAMDIFCLPSRTEGFPNALGEAMSMGLPCVSTQVGDVGVLVGDTAILVPPEDEQALAEGLLKVLALTNGQRQQMGKQSKERVMKEFSIAKTSERFHAVYRELVL
jgi:glycosyltransferase involved in cell wall biosynthesis